MSNRRSVLWSVALMAVFLNAAGAALGQTVSKAKPKIPASLIDPGSTEGNIYTNKTLGLRIKYPSRMISDSREELDRASEEGLEAYKDWDGKDSKIAEMLANLERSVFGISTPRDNSEPFASLLLSVTKQVGSGDLEQATARTVKFLTSAPNVKLVKPASKVEVAGMTCYTFQISLEVSGRTVLSTTYATKRNGHMLSFSIIYFDEGGLETMEDVLKGIELIDRVEQ